MPFFFSNTRLLTKCIRFSGIEKGSVNRSRIFSKASCPACVVGVSPASTAVKRMKGVRPHQNAHTAPTVWHVCVCACSLMCSGITAPTYAKRRTHGDRRHRDGIYALTQIICPAMAPANMFSGFHAIARFRL